VRTPRFARSRAAEQHPRQSAAGSTPRRRASACRDEPSPSPRRRPWTGSREAQAGFWAVVRPGPRSNRRGADQTAARSCPRSAAEPTASLATQPSSPVRRASTVEGHRPPDDDGASRMRGAQCDDGREDARRPIFNADQRWRGRHKRSVTVEATGATISTLRALSSAVRPDELERWSMRERMTGRQRVRYGAAPATTERFITSRAAPEPVLLARNPRGESTPTLAVRSRCWVQLNIERAIATEGAIREIRVSGARRSRTALSSWQWRAHLCARSPAVPGSGPSLGNSRDAFARP
jgi:hypothetical protein